MKKITGRNILIDTYTIEFRIEGDSLVPFEITNLLKLSPCQTKYVNTKNNLWAYDGISSENNFVEKDWKSLEEGLMFLLEKLLPKQNIIQSKLGQYKRYLWCGYFQESLNGGPTFSPKLLKKLSEFNTELIIRNY